jgi:hypothetical protein
MSSWRSVLLIPDAHIPDQHERAVGNIIDFAGEFQPDEIVILGDFLDCKGPARWSKGTAEEYQGDLQADADIGAAILGRLREVYGGPVRLLEGNHEARIRKYLDQYAPALSRLRAVRLDHLLRLPELDIELVRQPYRLEGSDWLAIHGDALATFGGGGALKMTRKLGCNVVQGHTHRLGLITETYGYRAVNADSETGPFRYDLTGMECGHVSDVDAAGYLAFGAANWQMGMGLIHYKPWTEKSQPEPVRIAPDGSFVVHEVEFP